MLIRVSLPQELLALRARVRAGLAAVQAQAQAPAVRWLGALCVLAAVIVGIYQAFRHCDCIARQYDDAYITFRYARNFAAGKGLVFNPGDRTDSASSFLYTLLLALADRLGAHDLPPLAASLGVCCTGLTGAVVYLACVERTRRPLLSGLLALLTCMHGLIAGWSVSGMETLLFTLLTSAAVYRLFVRQAFGWAELALVYLCVLTRFESALLALVYLGLAAVHAVHARGTERRTVLAQVLALGIGSCAFLAYKYALYGTIIPHAFALKTITRLYAPNPMALWSFWRDYALVWLVLGAAGLFSLPSTAHGLGFALFTVASVISVCVGPFSDWARYSAHLLPVCAMLASVPLSRLMQRLPLLALLACTLMAMQANASFSKRRSDIETGAGHEHCRKQIGRYLQAQMPKGTRVLSSDIGVIAYDAPSIEFVDAVGLTSKDVLLARMAGKNADAVLARLAPVLIADTCGGGCTRVQDFAAYNWLHADSYWRTPLPEAHYSERLHDGQVLLRCKSPDGLSFAVTRFTLSAAP